MSLYDLIDQERWLRELLFRERQDHNSARLCTALENSQGFEAVMLPFFHRFKLSLHTAAELHLDNGGWYAGAAVVPGH